MKKRIFIFIISSISIGISIFLFKKTNINNDEDFVSYIVDTRKQQVNFYWKDDKGEIIKSIGNLKSWLETKNEKLIFAMNGGMFKPDNSPQGLYVESGVQLASLDTANGKGNFYLKPNGVFCISSTNTVAIVNTKSFVNISNVKFATQSGPMLVINGEVNSIFNQTSENLNIRNGVGILLNNEVVFAMSKKEINFYNFAKYFKDLGCKNALYLDGFVSRTYLPEKNWLQIDGNFGVIIGVIEK